MANVSEMGANPATLLKRDGFRLISTRAAALPVWRVVLRCRVLKTNRITSFTEFTLRAVGLGIDNTSEISNLLNLPEQLVEGVVSELLLDRHLAVNASTGRSSLELAPSGRTLLSTLIQERVVETSVPYYVDAMSGEPVSLPRELTVTPEQIDDVPRLILEPDSEADLVFHPGDTGRFQAVNPARVEKDSSLLTIVGTEGATKFFIPAVALLFESELDEGDRYLRIAVDGRADERVEGLARETGILSSMQIDSRVEEDRRRVERFLPASVIAARASDAEVAELSAELEGLQSQPDSSEEEPATDDRRAGLRARLAEMAVRRLALAEVDDAVAAALAGARTSVVISLVRFWPSPGRDRHHALLRQVLESGVGLTLKVPSQMSKKSRAELDTLLQTLSDFDIDVEPSKPSHEASFIAVDNAWLTVFPGSPFNGIGDSPDRLGDDRPTLVRGSGVVAQVLAGAQPTAAASELRGAVRSWRS